MQAIIFRMAWVSPAGSASGVEIRGLGGPWRRFPGLAAPIPYPRPVSGVLGVSTRPISGANEKSQTTTGLASLGVRFSG